MKPDTHLRRVLGRVDSTSLLLRTWASTLLVSLVALFPAAAATPTLAHSAVTAGGRQTIGTVVVNSAIGGIGGSASVASFSARHGFTGQLTDVESVAVSGSPTTVNEATTRQLAAMATFTDSTVLPLTGTTATWSVGSGALASVSSTGLATAATVYQDTNGIARADYLGQFGTLMLSVLNVSNDDFGSYAGDGIDDAWQVQYFGIGNASAAATADPDGDGQNNLFEYLAGTNPTSSGSAFTLGVTGSSGQRTVTFAPVITGRTYTLEFTTNLTTRVFGTLLGGTTVDSSGTRAVTDATTTNSARYYRVKITLP